MIWAVEQNQICPSRSTLLVDGKLPELAHIHIREAQSLTHSRQRPFSVLQNEKGLPPHKASFLVSSRPTIFSSCGFAKAEVQVILSLQSRTAITSRSCKISSIFCLRATASEWIMMNMKPVSAHAAESARPMTAIGNRKTKISNPENGTTTHSSKILPMDLLGMVVVSVCTSPIFLSRFDQESIYCVSDSHQHNGINSFFQFALQNVHIDHRGNSSCCISSIWSNKQHSGCERSSNWGVTVRRQLTTYLNFRYHTEHLLKSMQHMHT